MSIISTPRSTLHALAPIGLGTTEVESLTSYFCRLANSHACSTSDLTQFVIDRIDPGRWAIYQGAEGKSRFVWYQRSISGLGNGALTWTSALAELTSVTCLHQLTLLPLQSVVAPKGLMAAQARWCQHCLQEDLEQKKTPYFRLAWDIGVNKVCLKHQAELIARCPYCQKTNVRHAASYVIPGWCTNCNCFLGHPEIHGPQHNSGKRAIEMEQALTIGKLLATSSTNDFSTDLDKFHQTIDTLIGEMDNGIASHFAKRLGVRKSTVHYWKNSRAPLTLEALVRVAIHCNVTLLDLLQSNLTQWTPPTASRQLSLELNYPPTVNYRARRELDWSGIRCFLRQELQQSKPKSVAEIARILDVDERYLYIQATHETRQLGERYVCYRHEQMQGKQAELHQTLKQACEHICQSGEGVSMELVSRLVGAKTLNATQNLYSVLSNLASNAANDDCV